MADLEILKGGSSIAREKFEATPTIHMATPNSRLLRGVFVSAEVRRRFSIINRAKGKLIAASRD